jgi:PmbA protein
MSMQDLMIGEVKALSLLEDALRSHTADQLELVLEAKQHAVTRYANNEIHQNVSASNTRIVARAVIGQASSRAFTNTLDILAIQKAIDEATAAARRQPAPIDSMPHYTILPSPSTTTAKKRSSAKSKVENTFFAVTADLSPANRAAWTQVIIEHTKAAGFTAFGTATSSVTELAVVNTLGLRQSSENLREITGLNRIKLMLIPSQ